MEASKSKKVCGRRIAQPWVLRCTHASEAHPHPQTSTHTQTMTEGKPEALSCCTPARSRLMTATRPAFCRTLTASIEVPYRSLWQTGSPTHSGRVLRRNAGLDSGTLVLPAIESSYARAIFAASGHATCSHAAYSSSSAISRKRPRLAAACISSLPAGRPHEIESTERPASAGRTGVKIQSVSYLRTRSALHPSLLAQAGARYGRWEEPWQSPTLRAGAILLLLFRPPSGPQARAAAGTRAPW